MPGRLVYIVLVVLAGAVSASIALRAYRARSQVARAGPFALMALSGACWMLLVALDNLLAGLFWNQVVWSLFPFAIMSTLLGLFYFSLEFSLRLKRVPRVVLYPTLVTALLIAGLSVTNPLHHRMWTVSQVNGEYVQQMGSLFTLQLAYTYLLTFASLALLVRAYLLPSRLLRRQTALLLVGILVPVALSIATEVLGWQPLPYVDVPALSLIFTILLFGWATLQFDRFYLLPVASDMIIRNMQDGILVTDIEGRSIFCNPAAQRIFARTEAQLIGLPAASILKDWQPEAYAAWEGQNTDVQLILGEGEAQYFQLTISPLVGNSQEPVGSLITLHNNTEQKNYEKRLNEMAISDPLTGCYNRRYFYEIARAYFHQAQRTSRPLSIMMIDLDYFKAVNDTYGHARGDLVLQQVALACRSLVRTQDIFSRYGGEEFVLAMPDTSLHNAQLVAERLRRAIEALGTEPGAIPVTASLGVVEGCGEPGLSLDTLLNRADAAMYAAKHAGRNRVAVWTVE
jgi:diguanylate cyclase (GGDEF)-like protein/PAS domain S-box-containing protein